MKREKTEKEPAGNCVFFAQTLDANLWRNIVSTAPAWQLRELAKIVCVELEGRERFLRENFGIELESVFSLAEILGTRKEQELFFAKLERLRNAKLRRRQKRLERRNLANAATVQPVEESCKG